MWEIDCRWQTALSVWSRLGTVGIRLHDIKWINIFCFSFFSSCQLSSGHYRCPKYSNWTLRVPIYKNLLVFFLQEQLRAVCEASKFYVQCENDYLTEKWSTKITCWKRRYTIQQVEHEKAHSLSILSSSPY